MSTTWIITPVLDESASLAVLLGELERHVADAYHLRVVVVDDGSREHPPRVDRLGAHTFRIDVLRLRRTVGHQRAIAAGLCHTVDQLERDDRVIVMDGDGEDRPETIPALLEHLHNSEADIVVAERAQRHEGVVFKGFYRLYQMLFRGLTGQTIEFGSFCAMTPAAVERIVDMSELMIHFPATVLKSRLRLVGLALDRGIRYRGSSKMNLVSLTAHGLRSVSVFVESVLTRMILFSVGLAVLCVFLIVLAFVLKILGQATPGWMTTAVGALLILLAQTAMLGLVSVFITSSSHHDLLMPDRAMTRFIETVEHHAAASEVTPDWPAPEPGPTLRPQQERTPGDP